MRFCCLCKRKSTQDNKIILHKFPKDPSIRQKWIKACGLHDKDVSRLHICSNHFELSENLLALKRLPLEAIPTVEKAVPNHPIELSNMSTNMSTNITNVLKSSKGNVTSPTVLYIMDQNNVVQSILEVATPDHSYCEAVFSPKKRLFAQPRYISEINISDVSSPKNARRLINFIKEEDRKKCSRIRCLSAHNKRLLKRVATLQELVSHLKEKVSEDVANNALINMRLSIDANDNCEQLSDKKQSKQAILKKKENSLIEDVSEPLVKWFEESPKQNFEKLDQLGDKKTQERFLLRKKEDLLTKDVSERLLVKQLQENPHLKIEDELAEMEAAKKEYFMETTSKRVTTDTSTSSFIKNTDQEVVFLKTVLKNTKAIYKNKILTLQQKIQRKDRRIRQLKNILIMLQQKNLISDEHLNALED
ncbi:uncharacterized protein LOC105204077 isoform X3 [Solenopsis invicta]|uniref:uncharacterized protein LOC105204077 isoform X3 n=1 Tax=Solenopsis invicta TaxID=13686 RepID=UPI00193D36DE|nr:uncharacterized protein LOC105204077 isoform X3 [Solenopsis invicta]